MSTTKPGDSLISSGPGRSPCSHSAASSTAAGALPGTASESTGMIAPPMQALFPDSAATTPSKAPLPNFSGVLLDFFSAQYDSQPATSSPTPGMMPMATPISDERTMLSLLRSRMTKPFFASSELVLTCARAVLETSP